MAETWNVVGVNVYIIGGAAEANGDGASSLSLAVPRLRFPLPLDFETAPVFFAPGLRSRILLLEDLPGVLCPPVLVLPSGVGPALAQPLFLFLLPMRGSLHPLGATHAAKYEILPRE